MSHMRATCVVYCTVLAQITRHLHSSYYLIIFTSWGYYGDCWRPANFTCLDYVKFIVNFLTLNSMSNWLFSFFQMLGVELTWKFNFGTALKITGFWYVSPSSVVDLYQRFGGTYCLHLQGRRVSHISVQHLIYHAMSVVSAEDSSSTTLSLLRFVVLY
jgi:hypothetical protein